MSEFYTHANFKLFQEELMACCIDCQTKIVRDDLTHTVFEVLESDKGARLGQVTFDAVTRVPRCSCARFESDGIPCHHILVVMRSSHVNELPDHYLLPRWAKKSNDETSGQWIAMLSVTSGFNVGKLWTIFTRCVKKATRSEDAFSFATEPLERYESDLNEYVSTSPSLGCGASSIGSAKYADTIATHPPKMSKTKGSGRRIKGGKELAMERQE